MYATLSGMKPLSDDYLRRFSEAVVQEIWNEMGRQRITSLRELARRAGMTHTAINVRMNGDSRTGKQVTINVRDLAAIGNALSVGPAELVGRAKVAVDDELAQRRRKRKGVAVQTDAARDEEDEH